MARDRLPQGVASRRVRAAGASSIRLRLLGINASPISYELDGTQYIAMLSGLGGDPSFYYKAPKGGMLWVFALGGAGEKAPAGGGVNPVPIEGALPTFGK